MNQCVNDIVAFGLNQKELDMTVIFILLIMGCLCVWGLLRYLEPQELKDERWARKNPFLAADLKAQRGSRGSYMGR